jgi:hypothetical protein
MSAKKKHPGLELGPILINQVRDYLGVRQINKLSTVQLANISRCCNATAETIGEILEDQKNKTMTMIPAVIHNCAPTEITITEDNQVKQIEHKPALFPDGGD